MSQQAHQESVAAAKNAIADVQELLAVALDKADTARALVEIATGGGQAATEAGRMSFELTVMIDVKLQEADGVCANAVAELDRYAGGF